MRKRKAVFFVGLFAFGMVMGNYCMDNPFPVLADDPVGEMSADVVSDGAIKDTTSSTKPSPTPAAKTTVSFKKDSETVPFSWYKKITATATSKKGKAVEVSYTSSNTKIATVDQEGKVTGLKEGTVTITAIAKDGSKEKATCAITVKKEKKGWHKVSDTKKYYVKKDGTRAIGYTKIDGDYYFGKTNSYVLTEQWKYVDVDGTKYKLYFGKNGKQSQNVSALIGEQGNYRLEVNLSKNIVVVYAKDGNKGYTIPVKAMVCSCGVPGHSTRQGTYRNLIQTGKWHTLKYGVYGKYCTRYSGPYLFHSVTYTRNYDSYSLQGEEYKKLGKLASHGCIRLAVKDAKWIYQNARKCEANIFTSDKKSPLKKPAPEEPVKTDDGRYYDPTDKDITG